MLGSDLGMLPGPCLSEAALPLGSSTVHQHHPCSHIAMDHVCSVGGVVSHLELLMCFNGCLLPETLPHPRCYLGPAPVLCLEQTLGDAQSGASDLELGPLHSPPALRLAVSISAIIFAVSSACGLGLHGGQDAHVSLY